MQAAFMSDVPIEKLRSLAKAFVEAEPGRIGSEGFWKTPLLVSAPIDERFDVLPKVAFNAHLHPRDLLPSAKSLIVFFIPFKSELVIEKKKRRAPLPQLGARLCSNQRFNQPLKPGV
jgi:hypothetical protein